MAFGASGAHYDLNFTINAFSTGIASFNGQATGLGLADFLTGNLFSFVQADTGGGGSFYPRQRHVGLYGQDTRKVTPRLTLNWGLRWEPYLPIQFHQGPIHFDRDAFQNGIKTTKITNAPPGIFYPGDPGFPGRSGMYNRWWNFSPRMGLAWDPEGDGRMSIRGSFGTFYDFPPMQMFLATKNIPPWSGKVEVRNVRFEDPWRDYPGGDPFPIVINKDTPFPPLSIFGSLDYDTHNTSVSQWNLSIQRQIGADWLVSASYLGSNSVHLWTHKALNPAIYFPGGPCTINRVTYNPCSTTANTDRRRPLYLENPEAGQLLGVVNTIDDGGTASYHGMVASIQRRPTRGVTINANYTWSHCITDPYDELTPGGSGGATYTDPTNRRADRGNCTASATDRRHVFNLTAVAETPQFSNPTLRAVATGWRLSPILRLQSGGYMSVTTSRDIALNGISNQRLNQVLPNVYGDKSLTNYLNPRALALPATGTRGNMGTDNIAGPGLWQFDVALSRTFRSRETQRLEFRAEAFNVTNSLVKNNPITNFDSSNFGQINSARDPRIMQFALKYIF